MSSLRFPALLATLSVAAISLATCGGEIGEPRASEAPPAAGKRTRLPIARLFGGVRAWPTTAFYEASGKLAKTHLGAYATEGKLDQDLRRYVHGG
jgi:hypothetical protein